MSFLDDLAGKANQARAAIGNAAGNFAGGVAQSFGLSAAKDAAQLGVSSLTRNQKGVNNATTHLATDLPAFFPIAGAEAFKNGFGQQLATAVTAPYAEHVAQQQADYARHMLNNRTGDPAHDAAVESYANGVYNNLLNQHLATAGVDQNTSRGNLVKKVGGAAAQTAANIAMFSKIPGVQNAGALKSAGLFGGLNAVSSMGQTAQDTPGADLLTYLKSGTGGFVSGAALPLAIHGVTQGVPLAMRGVGALRDYNTAQGAGGYVRVSDGSELSPGKARTDYGINHAPNKDYSAPGHDLSNKGNFVPKDIYTNPEYYSNIRGNPSDPYVKATQESFANLAAVRNKPNAEITIYRAAPKDELNQGDWVTPSKTYAQQHAAGQGGKVYAYKVKASELRWPGDDLNEFGFFGKKVTPTVSATPMTVKPASQPIRNMTSALEAQRYKDFPAFYKDYKPFFDEQGMDAKAAQSVYTAAINQPATPIGTRGARISSGAQTMFEQAYTSGNMAKAREFAQQIEDPVSRTTALQAIDGQAAPARAITSTNPTVQKMIEQAQANKAQQALIHNPQAGFIQVGEGKDAQPAATTPGRLNSILQFYEQNPKSFDLEALKAEFKNDPAAQKAIAASQSKVAASATQSRASAQKQATVDNMFNTAGTVGDIRAAEAMQKAVKGAADPLAALKQEAVSNSVANNFVNIKSPNHQIYYNGKVVDMGYTGTPKDQFRYGAMRIKDNGATGYIKTPNGDYYYIGDGNKAVSIGRPDFGGTIRPEHAPAVTTMENAAIPGELSAARAASVQARVNETKAFMASRTKAPAKMPDINNPEAGFVQISEGKGVQPPIEPPKATATANPSGAKASKFNSTVVGSPEVSPKVAAAVKHDPGTYDTTSNQEHLANSNYYVTKMGLKKAQGDIMERLSVPTGKIDHQTTSDAIATAKALDGRGKGADLQAATDVYTNLAEHLSKQGQSIQAASLLNNRTPEGLKFGALRALQKGGVPITPELQRAVQSLTENVRAAAPGSDAHSLAVSQLVHFVNNKLPRSRMDAATGIWRAGLLTGPETAAKVAFSHAITLPFETAAQIPTAIADRAMSLFTGKRATMATLRGAGGGVAQGAKDFTYKMKTGIDAPNSGGEIPDFGSRTHQTAYESFVGNLHGGLFKPAYEGRYRVSLNDQALTEAHNAGLKGAERESFIKNFVGNPSDKAKETAAFDAARATNQQETDLGKMAQGLQHVTMAGIPVGKFLAPFTRIPSAIGTVGMVDYTPLGVAREVVSQIKAGKFDQRLMSQAIGRSATGTATAGLGAALMANGRMTLKAPDDKKDRSLWTMEGKQPNSIYLGGTVTKGNDSVYKYHGGNWISLNSFGAIGIVTGLGGAMSRALNSNKGDLIKAVPDALASTARLLMDQPYFKGVSGAANALNDPTRYAQTFLDNTVGSIIPTGVSQTARGFDSFQRSYPTNIPDTLKAGIPGLRETLPVQQDLYGNSLRGTGGNLPGAINGTVNPFYPQAARNQSDPVTNELQRLYNSLGSSTSPNIALPGKNLTINGQKLTMTPQQLHDYIAGSGPILQQGITNLLSNPQYQALGDEQKANEINKVITAAHTVQNINQFGDKPKTMTAGERQALANPSKIGQLISAKTTASSPAATYQQDLLKYQQQKAGGQLTPVQDYTIQRSLAKEAITSKYSMDITNLYGMSRANIASYLRSNPTTANQTYAQLQQLDQQLYNSGMVTRPKFGGSITLSPTAGGRVGTAKSSRSSKVGTSNLISTVSRFSKLAASAKVGKVSLANHIGQGRSIQSFSRGSTTPVAVKKHLIRSA